MQTVVMDVKNTAEYISIITTYKKSHQSMQLINRYKDVHIFEAVFGIGIFNFNAVWEFDL
jgi:hypothetical protein